MRRFNIEEFAKLEHLNVAGLGGRTLALMPLWDGQKWRLWVAGNDGQPIELQIVDIASSTYLTRVGAADEADIHIPFVEMFWQRLSYPSLCAFVQAIEDDFHQLATTAAKLEHFYGARNSIDPSMLTSFVRADVEHFLVVARSIFDLLQEAMSRFWNTHVRLLNPEQDALKRQNQLPANFAKLVFTENRVRTAVEMSGKYATPELVAAQYERHSGFFDSLRSSRDRIVHATSSVGHIFSTEFGFAVGRREEPYSEYSWQPVHEYNENLVSLMPWLGDIIRNSVVACNEILSAFLSVIQVPDEVAPGHRIMFRDPTNGALERLLEASSGTRIWWSSSPIGLPSPKEISGAQS